MDQFQVLKDIGIIIKVKQLEEVGGISSDGSSKLYSIDWWTVPDDPDIFPHKGYNDKLFDFEKKRLF